MAAFTFVLVSLFFVYLVLLLFKFAFADADFTLLSKKRVKREEIEDKVVWITGASRGIGEVLAKQLASLGAKLILSARNEAELERVRSQLTGKYAPGEVKILPLDLASGEAALSVAVERAVALFPGSGVDYMFHNAAYERPKSPVLDVPEESLKATFDVNVLGTISLTRLLAPHMLRQGGGHFVVVELHKAGILQGLSSASLEPGVSSATTSLSSGQGAAGKTPAPGQSVYSASKFALNGYFHSLRSELCQKGIKVTVVCPGPIETSKSSPDGTSEQKSSEKRVPSERCVELTIIAASHGLKEAWISYQPVLGVMYLVQYMPSVGFWLMDKVGARRVEVAAKKGNTYSLGLLFGKEKRT